ncbi:uncharacterized protein LOC112546746 isoform X2 [Pelodiscus sinensis]|uniref:uncharacterized protein LOC112546746 isoform X2 n=1 Tax=Pelodiscus sinensis TaxID=13735 RepID=UPI003F6AAE20
MLRDTPSSLPSEFSRLAEDGSPCGPAGPFHFGPFRGLARKGVHSLYQVILHHRGKEPSRDLGPRVPAAGVVSQPFSPRLAQGGMHPSVFPSFCPLCPSICPGMHAGTRGRGRAQTCQQNDPVLSLPGLNIHQAEDLWCRHWYKERWVLAHSNTVRVGENLEASPAGPAPEPPAEGGRETDSVWGLAAGAHPQAGAQLGLSRHPPCPPGQSPHPVPRHRPAPADNGAPEHMAGFPSCPRSEPGPLAAPRPCCESPPPSRGLTSPHCRWSWPTASVPPAASASPAGPAPEPPAEGGNNRGSVCGLAAGAHPHAGTQPGSARRPPRPTGESPHRVPRHR